MGTPLTIKQPTKSSKIQQYLLGGVLAFLVLYLRHLKTTGGTIHYSPASLNLLAHAALVFAPVALAWAALYKPFEFRESTETILEPKTYWSTLQKSWWMMLIFWSAPLLALCAAIYELFHFSSSTISTWATGPGSAFLTMLLSLGFGFVYGTILRERNQVRISEEGLRNGLVHFHEWQNIDHISIEGDTYGIYNKANPLLPFSYFKLASRDNTQIVAEYMAKNNIRQSYGPEPQLLIVKTSVLTATVAIVLAGFWLYLTTNIDFRWLLIGVFIVSIGTTMVLEVVRGVAKVTTTKPLIEPETVEAVSK